MLVDLARNDMGRISEFGTVKVTDFMSVKIIHMSCISSRWSRDAKKGSFHPFDLLASFLPAGTLSGAPKIRAMEIIEELESVRRGLYGGATGYVDFSGDMDFCITIRTMIKKEKRLFTGRSWNRCRFCSGKMNTKNVVTRSWLWQKPLWRRKTYDIADR